MELPGKPTEATSAPTSSEPTPSTSTTLPTTLPTSLPTQSDASSTANPEDPAKKSTDGSSENPKSELAPIPSKSATLESQIQALSSLQSRLARIRVLPAHLLIFHSQSPLISLGGISGLALGDGDGSSETDTINSLFHPDAGSEATTKAREMGSQARTAFRMISDAREELVEDVTQGALKAARESEAQDKSEISLPGRRARKKRRIVTADSPAPFPAFHLETTRVFPTPRQKDRKVENLDDLALFIREHNICQANLVDVDKRFRTRLSIWSASRAKSGVRYGVSDPLTVRVVIRDVATIFVKLRHRNHDSGRRGLSVESIVALGPREKKSPHSHSDYTVYQKLTQQIALMVEKEPSVFFSQLVDLLTSYEELFVTHCTICRRVLQLEGHVPPVARVWKETLNVTESERGHWEARHISCLHA